MNPSQKSAVNEDKSLWGQRQYGPKGQEIEHNEENRHRDANGENVPKLNDEILKEFKSVDRKEIECSLHAQENHHLKSEFCTQNWSRLGSRLPYKVPLKHVHNFDPP